MRASDRNTRAGGEARRERQISSALTLAPRLAAAAAAPLPGERDVATAAPRWVSPLLSLSLSRSLLPCLPRVGLGRARDRGGGLLPRACGGGGDGGMVRWIGVGRGMNGRFRLVRAADLRGERWFGWLVSSVVLIAVLMSQREETSS